MPSAPAAPAGVPAGTPPPSGASAGERDDVGLLTGEGVEHLLEAALATSGARLRTWRVHEVHHRPGVGVTVGLVVGWVVDTGEAGGLTGEDYLLATTAPVPDGAAVVTALLGGRTVHVWRHPADPALPGLTAAADPAGAAGRAGLADPALELVTYRPLRRAVLRVTGRPADGRADDAGLVTRYLKVVRPHTAPDLHRRHELLRAASVPAAPSRVAPDGVLVLDELRGVRLTDALAADGARDLDPRAVVDLLDAFPPALLDLPRRPAWAEHVQRYGEAAGTLLPARAAEVAGIVRDVSALVGRAPAGAVVPTHGDLHEANLLVTGAHVVGVLDVDAAGPGHRVDDLACLLAHMSVLPTLDAVVHRHVPDALARWTSALERVVDPVALHARAAAVALSLVPAGASRVDDGVLRRLEVARTWSAQAHRLAGLDAPPVPGGTS